MFKKGIQVLAVWGIIFLVFALMMEGILRLRKADVNPLVEITQQQSNTLLVPHQVIKSASSIPGEFAYTATINQHGLRGKEFNLTKDPDTQRILMIGDSFTFGVGVEDDQTIPAQLEKRLKERNLDFEVINAGAGHLSPVKHWVNWRKIFAAYEPDVVILMLDLTDLWDDYHWLRKAVYGKDGEIDHFNPMYIDGKRDWWITLTYYSYFCRYLNTKVVRTFQKIKTIGFSEYIKARMQGKRAKAVIAQQKEIKDALIEFDGLLFMRGKERQAIIREHFKTTAEYINKIKQDCDHKGIKFVIVMYPHGIYVGPEEWQQGRLTWGFEPNKVYTDYFAFDLVREWADHQGIYFVNTLEYFLAHRQAGTKYFFDWDGHMTKEGYAMVANALVDNRQFLSAVRIK